MQPPAPCCLPEDSNAGRQWEHRQTRITAGNTPTAAQQRVILFVLDDPQPGPL